MIPKIIHYCWFGNNPKSDLIKQCISSWETYLPDYEIVEWNEKSFDINSCKYVKDAYTARKWAHVSDYVRAFALYSVGGIYLDTDVEIRRPLDTFLHHGAFSGFESKGYPFTALWGAEKGHHWPLHIIDYYKDREFSLETNTVSVTRILETVYNIDPQQDRLQHFEEDIYIYPSYFFCLDFPNYATHHFEGSWLDDKQDIAYKEHVRRRFFRENFFDSYSDFDTALSALQDYFRVSSSSLLRLLVGKAVTKLFNNKKA